MSDEYELQFHLGVGFVRDTFGQCLSRDDIPTAVKTTDGDYWDLRFVDDIDRVAIYTRRGAAAAQHSSSEPESQPQM